MATSLGCGSPSSTQTLLAQLHPQSVPRSGHAREYWLHSTSDCPLALLALGRLKGICRTPLLVPKITSWDTNITTPFQHTQPPSTNALLSPQQWFKPDLGLWIFSFVPLLSNQCSGEHFILHSHHDNGLRPRHNSLARFPRLMNFWALAALFKIDSSLIAPTASVDLVAHPSILLRELWLSVFLSSAPYHHQHLAVGSCPVSGRSLHGCPLIHEFGQLPFNLASNSSHLCWAAIQQLLAYPFSHFSSERAQTERKLREKKKPHQRFQNQEPGASGFLQLIAQNSESIL